MTGRRVGRAVDASMGLLTDIANKALEPDYALAARRPQAARSPAARAGHAGLSLALAVVLGAGTLAAILQLRSPAAAGESPRALLAREITARTADTEELSGELDSLTAEIASIQAEALAADPALLALLEESELLSGAVPVAGPGLVMVIEDGPGAEGESGDPDARVQDVDLQVVTNGLWAAGAEAIAVNGQRLTALSAIRSGGDAILVDLAPLLPPYRIEAIGDVRGMQTAFARSVAANHLTFLTSTYEIAVTTTSDDELRLPGSPSAALRHASALGSVASSDQTSGRGSP